MSSLCVVEVIPFLIIQLFCISSRTHIRSSSLLNIFTSCIFVLFSKMLFHKFFGENFSCSSRNEKSNKYDLKSNQNSSNNDIAKSIRKSQIDCSSSSSSEMNRMHKQLITNLCQMVN